MPKQNTSIKNASQWMGRGDVIAFGGRCLTSKGIQLFTTSAVSHVGMVYTDHNNNQPLIVESTSMGPGKAGVKFRDLEEALTDYPGRVWWLPLCDQADEQMDWAAWQKWTDAQVGKEYDFKQVFGVSLARIPFIGKYLVKQDDFRQMFCSELVAGAFEAGGLLPRHHDASHTTPEEICEFRVFDSVTQLRGTKKEIRGFSKRQVFYPELDKLPGRRVD